MSDTISVDVVGPSHWAFMATVMAECLEKFIDTREVVPSDIPQGVYDDALDFFDLVMGAARGTLAEDPPASINAYVIATDALTGSLKPVPETSEALVSNLGRYAGFMGSLTEAHALSPDEVETAGSLRDFFRSLAKAGEAEVYVRTIQAEHLTTGYSLIY